MNHALPRWLSSLTILLLCASSATAQTTNTIWAEKAAPQPFDKAPFHAVKIPAWVESTIGCGYTLSNMNTQQREAAVKHGVTISEMGFVDPFYAYYDSKLLKKRSPHVPLGNLEKDIAEYKRLGVRILGVYPPCLQSEAYELHPDWRRIATNTTEIPSVDLKVAPHGGMLCLLGPYGDFFIDVLAEIVTKYPDVDAFSFDGLHYGGVCYCQHCRTAHKADTGKDIPNADLSDAAFRRYQHWADRRMENLIQRMQTRLKKIKPDIALVTWTTNAGRYGHFLSIPRNMPARMNLLLDAPDQEFWLDETNRGATIVPAFANAYMWSITNHRVAFSEPYLMSHGNPYGKDSFPPHEVLRRMLLAATYGCAPSIAVGQPEHLQPGVYHAMDEVQLRKAWLTHKRPEAYAALVMSDNTKNFYGRAAGLVEERYLANVFGTFRACVEEHLPVTVINDWSLTDDDLKPYKVLLLPNTASLDDQQVAAITRFVERGGGLVASLDTSLFNEYGDPRPDFALRDVLGVSYRGLPDVKAPAKDDIDVNFAQALGPDYWEKRKSVFHFRQDTKSLLNVGKMQTYVGPQAVTFKGPALRVAVKDEKAQTVAKLEPHGGAEGTALPAVVARQHGQGRVVYFAAGLDAAYYSYAYPYQRVALRNAIDWAANAAPPVRVAAPMCVHASLMRQTKQGERLLLHLFNDVNTTAQHAFPNDDVPLREETLPIHDIAVTFAPQYKITRVHLEPGGKELTVQSTGQGPRVIVPKLEVHSIVVAELQSP